MSSYPGVSPDTNERSGVSPSLFRRRASVIIFVHRCVSFYPWASIPKLFTNVSSISVRSEQTEQLPRAVQVIGR